MNVTHRILATLIKRDLRNPKITLKQLEPHVGTVSWLLDEMPNNREVINLEKQLNKKINQFGMKK